MNGMEAPKSYLLHLINYIKRFPIFFNVVELDFVKCMTSFCVLAKLDMFACLFVICSQNDKQAISCKEVFNTDQL